MAIKISFTNLIKLPRVHEALSGGEWRILILYRLLEFVAIRRPCGVIQSDLGIALQKIHVQSLLFFMIGDLSHSLCCKIFAILNLGGTMWLQIRYKVLFRRN